ncbi:MAG: GspE/PulE family protein, partial [Puniceicoccales bacterium]
GKGLANLQLNHFDTQDGMFSVLLDGEMMQLRASAIPIRNHRAGAFQKLVLRLLGGGVRATRLNDLKLEARDHGVLLRASQQKQGLVLVTGPTGSGKTTTLYACLAEINRPTLNIQTIEEPIEIELEGVNQTAVDRARGVDFARIMRSVLRQDPDVILLGEMRDRESALIAAEAAMTGHLVFSTLHTNTALESVRRLRQFNVPIQQIESSLLLLQAQRLVKVLCENCKHPVKVSDDVRALFHDEDVELGDVLYRPQGCAACDGAGVSGRRAVMELVPIDPDLRDAIATELPESQLRKLASQRGGRTLFQAALSLAGRGVIPLEEAQFLATNWTRDLHLFPSD